MSNYFKHKLRSKSPIEIIGMVVFGGIFITAMIALCGYVIMWLWNWLLPDLFGITIITYWQAMGIFALSKILLGGGCGFGGGGSSKCDSDKKSSYSDKSKKRDFSKWKYYDEFWEEHGNQAYEEFLKRKEDNKEDRKEDI